MSCTDGNVQLCGGLTWCVCVHLFLCERDTSALELNNYDEPFFSDSFPISNI